VLVRGTGGTMTDQHVERLITAVERVCTIFEAGAVNQAAVMNLFMKLTDDLANEIARIQHHYPTPEQVKEEVRDA
jgi:hypothetical protein